MNSGYSGRIRPGFRQDADRQSDLMATGIPNSMMTDCTTEDSGQNPELVYLLTNKLNQNPQQPRFRTDDKKLAALADSVKIYGVLEPILVCRRGDKYTLIAGHRRLAAAIMTGLEEIPARILSSEFFDYLGAALTENMLREDLNPLEVAMALNELADGGAVTTQMGGSP